MINLVISKKFIILIKNLLLIFHLIGFQLISLFVKINDINVIRI